MDAYSIIRMEILNGDLKPGERLREEMLAKKLNISRTPIREAIRKLTVEGLLLYSPNRGVTVRSYTIEDVRDTYNLRALIEGHAASLAASNPKRHELLSALERANENYQNAIESRFNSGEKETELIVKANQEFHDTIITMSQNSYIKKILHSLVAIPVIFRGFHRFEKEELLTSNLHHNQILKAIKNGDPYQAQVLMATHLYHGRDYVLHHNQKVYLK
ncbi:GntR family transcriptional regulator [Alkalihalobacterium alkalinitrilicum]|uniref:GntR family transcriptional regulator n=1 Tax=Alkalihalobacterium alkalinitrilicum TaxID=427920 RepID=UPI00130334C6|nr:GntR family transcriptional regulator [Alkalihalobacterium alkalinitrilicum]